MPVDGAAPYRCRMRPAVLYDDDCGFCRRSGRIVAWLRLPVDVVAIADADLDALGVDPVLALAQMPFVDERGRVVYGHHAWAQALQRGVWPLRALGRLLASRRVEPVARSVYGWIAANRYRLPGASAACAVSR